jgi:hypothetical protein
VPTDPYVSIPLDEHPRQQQNFAPGVEMPPARAWVADRPGDVRSRSPRGPLTGTPGPNVGFALTLAHRARDRFRLEPGERAEDAVAVVAELAMKRAATFGRAPTILDVDFAIELLGYAGAAPDDVRRWRPGVVRGADHDYVVRRGVADAVGSSLLRLSLHDLPEHLAAVRAAISSGEHAVAAGSEGADDDAGRDTPVDADAAPSDAG